MKARHFLSRIAIVLAVAAVSAPLAQARGLDDWFRDKGAIRHELVRTPGAVLVDDWFRSPGMLRALAGTANSSVAVDDYFRGSGSTAQATRTQSPVVDDYFRDNGSTAGVTKAQSPVVVDDYFRGPALAPAGGSGFDWDDAGIGAASGFGLALGIGGLGLVVLQRWARPRPARQRLSPRNGLLAGGRGGALVRAPPRPSIQRRLSRIPRHSGQRTRSAEARLRLTDHARPA